MNALPYILATLVAAFAIFQMAMVVKAKRMRGRNAPDTSALIPPSYARQVLYFHSPHCGPCKAMTPVVERLQSRYPNLAKLDVAEHLDLARQFGVTATPTLIRIENGVIRDVLLGAVSEKKLEALLESDS